MDSIEHQPSPQARRVPIVGIGASAGGLEAIIDLLSGIPAPCGMSLLVVQHLDPTRPSLLTDILAKHSPLPVAEAVHDMRIDVDHLYVIPPNTSMSVDRGHLKIRPRDSTMGPPMPIDDLFESLATDQGSNAIGIVLSGSGTDGAIGMQALKEAGGITFAQDEASARFNSMPHAAIELGCVDLVLPPAAMSGELLRIARHAFRDAAEPGDLSADGTVFDEDDFRRLFRLLRSACNIDFSHYKRGTIQRRLTRRMVVHAVDGLAAYLKVLEAEPAEAHALCRDLLIRYTEFFRDPDAFQALGSVVFPRVLHSAGPASPIRIWVPGCATGEEVYSIAICLMEYLTAHALNKPVQIFGTDISEEALEVARTGRYIENIARNVSAERLNRFFTREGDHYRIAKSIRNWCTFARQNVVYDPPFSSIDLLSCRNLLIYLDPILQKRVMPAFHFALQRDGVLMLGMSETVGAYSDLFGVLDAKRGKLFSKHPAPNRFVAAPTLLPSLFKSPPPMAGEALPERLVVTPDAIHGEIDRVGLARYLPACVLCDESFNVLEFRGDLSPYLVHPEGMPTHQLQRLARPGIFLAVRNAIRQVRREGAPVRKDGLHVDIAGQPRQARLDVVPVMPRSGEGRWFLVFFIPADEAAPVDLHAHGTFWRDLQAAAVTRLAGRGRRSDDVKDRENARLSEEVRALREQIRLMLEEHESAIEELKTLEEETLSSNEEFQSTNEELETAKEELQSLNEELSTTNDELRFRNRELKVTHDEASQARDYANALIETISEPLLVLNAEIRVERANQAFYEAFKTNARDTLNASLYTLGNGQWNVPELRELLEDVLPTRTSVRGYEISANFPKVGVRTIRINASRVAWPERALILLSIDDVTEHHRTLRELTEGDRQKDEFLAMLAHELRNPLAAMSNAMQLWRHEHADAQTKQHAVATMARQLRHQIRMVDDLLDIARVTRGVVVLQIERVDLAHIVRQAYDSLREPILARRHEVTLALPAGGLIVDGDATRLEQVVTNLLGNAIKYTSDGGRIDVSLQREGTQAVLIVADTGIGMTKHFLSELFQVFVQAEKSLDRNQGGLGIGLAVVRRLVELHGGTVEANSAGLGTGSRFTVRLQAAQPTPRSVPTAAATAVASAPEQAAPAAPRRILVVDDNEDVAQGTAALLRLAGHDVQVAFDGPSALKRAQAFLPQAILLDIGMPGMNGYEVCRQLRRDDALDDPLIIAVSGFGQLEDVGAAREAGFDDHVTKPADPQQLDRVLRDARPRRAGP